MNVSKVISSLESVPRCGPDRTVGSALALSEHTHAAVFVFDTKNQFLGLLSPYETLFRKQIVYTTLVSSALISPPRLTATSSMFEVVDFMLSSRMYTVPIFDEAKNEVIGKVDINDFFNAISADDILLQQLSDVVQINSPVTIGSNATVSDTYQLLREEAVSRLVLVNEFNSLEGIISRSDVELAFTRPTPKQRFSTRDGDHNNFSFDEEKKKRNDASIQSLITRSVASIADTTTMKEKITTLIASEHFDLVVTSTDNKPVGIITSRDLLTGIKQLDSEEVAHILLLKPSDTVSDVVVDHAYQFLQNFGKKMGKRDELSRLEVSCEEPRYPSGETAVFNTTLKVLFANGNDYIANTKDSSFLSSVRSAVAQATKQIQRNKVQSSYP